MLDIISREKIVSRIAASGVEAATECFAECLKFLSLCASKPGTSYVPSKFVDQGWHEFVLCTREYVEFCQQECGGYVHHDPSDQPDFQAYEATRQALLAREGSLNEAFWPAAQPGDCTGNCSSGKCKSHVGSCSGTCTGGSCKSLF